MATAKINKDGDKVVLKLSFREAAALRALLSRVGEETHEQINEDTMGPFLALDNLHDEVRGSSRVQDYWPDDFGSFMERTSPLIESPDEMY